MFTINHLLELCASHDKLTFVILTVCMSEPELTWHLIKLHV